MFGALDACHCSTRTTSKKVFKKDEWPSKPSSPREREFDAVCAGPGRVIVAEAKSTPTAEAIDRFAEKAAEFFDFFPEYDACELYAVFSSWEINPKLRDHISARGLYGMAMGEETMAIVARPAVKL